MIQLNGYKERWFAGAGALGFDGFDAGHPPLVRLYKWPFRAAGLLDPHQFTVISKTVTRHPRVGRQTNWGFRKYAWPVRPLSRRSMVNAVALTNPGFDVWERVHYRHAIRKGIKLVLSLHIDTEQEAYELGIRCRRLRDLAAVQINAGCPNLAHAQVGGVESEVQGFVRMIDSFQSNYNRPLLVKFRMGQPWERMAEALEGRCAGYELINAVPWDVAKGLALTPAEVPAGVVSGDSPFTAYGVGGSVSGGRIEYQAVMAMCRYKQSGGLTPVISGGGVVAHAQPHGYPSRWQSLESVVSRRFENGADAVAFATAFLWEPWGPNRTIRAVDARLDQDAQFRRAVSEVREFHERERNRLWPPSRRGPVLARAADWFDSNT